VHAVRGELDRAEEQHRRALALHEEIGSRLGQAQTLGNLGLLEERRANVAAARELLGRAAALYKQIGAGDPGPEAVAAALKRLEDAGNP
jgi:hypothetical protein